MNTDEFYHILRRRLFERLPDESEIEAVAHAYGNAVREAKQMDVTNASPEQFAAQIKESYPFHPAIRDLYARFRENQGFQQTRGLIRLMRIVVSRIWASDRDPYLIAAHDIDLGSQETLTEINQINVGRHRPRHRLRRQRGGGTAGCRPGRPGRRGCPGRDAPAADRLARQRAERAQGSCGAGDRGCPVRAGPDVSRIKNEVIARLATAAWYLHSTNDGRLHVRNVQPDRPRHDHRRRLPARPGDPRGQGTAHADLRPGRGHLLSAAAAPAGRRRDRCRRRARHADRPEPHPAGLNPDLRTLYDQHTYQNRLCFLTGQRAFDSLLESARELKAIDQIITEMHEEGVADGDPQMQQAREQLLPRYLTRFHSAIRETFTTLHYPTHHRLATADFLMEFLDNRYNRCGRPWRAGRSTPRTSPARLSAGAPVHPAIDAVDGDQAPRGDFAGVAVAPPRRSGPAEGRLPAQGPVARGRQLCQRDPFPSRRPRYVSRNWIATTRPESPRCACA